MQTTKEVLLGEINAAEGVLYMARESSDKKWKVALSGGGVNQRQYAVDGGSRADLDEFRRDERRRITELVKASRVNRQ